MAQLEEKHLKGLMSTGATAGKAEVNGKKKVKWTPFKRPMKQADVLAFAERGGDIVIVGKDGAKHRVPKTGAKAD